MKTPIDAMTIKKIVLRGESSQNASFPIQISVKGCKTLERLEN